MKSFNVTFNDLTEEKQLDLLRENKKEVLEEASKSIFVTVRLEVVKDLETTYEILEKMLEVEENRDVIREIIDHPNFQRTEKNLVALSKHTNWHIREKVAGWEEMTNEIFEVWLEREKDDDVIWEIINHPNFQRTERNLISLSKCSRDWIREKVAGWEEMTNEIFELWLEREENGDVIRKIINHPNFQRTERNLISLSKCSEEWIIEVVVDWKEMTNEIFELWLEREDNPYVIRKIINYPNFQRTKKNLISLSKCPNWHIRKKVAGWEEMTNEIFELWLEREEEEDGDVIETIIDNPNFQRTKKNLISLSKCPDEHIREEVAGWEEMTNEIFELWLEREEDGDVIEAIIDNPNFQRTERNLISLSKCSRDWIREEVAGWEEMTNEIFELWLEREEDGDVIEAIITNPKLKKEGETQEILETFGAFLNMEIKMGKVINNILKIVNR